MSARPGARKPRRVLCLAPYPREAASVRHRICEYRDAWAAAGFDLTVWSFMSRRFFAIRRRFGAAARVEKLAHFVLCTARLLVRLPFVARFDVVIVHREAFPLGAPWYERAAAWLNPRLVFDLDDATWHPPTQAVNQRRFLWCADRVWRLMRMSRVVVVGNPYLSEHAGGHAARVVVIPTPYRDLGGPAARAGGEEGPPIIVWIGNLGNAEYLLPVWPVLRRLAEGRRFRVRLIGGADIDALGDAGLELERLRWEEAHEAEWLRGSDIGIMPLPDDDYEQGKCAFKLVQYFSAGLPVVASPVGMNRAVVRHGLNGYLAAGAEGWHESLALLLDDALRRREMGAQGRATFLRDFTRPPHAAAWVQVLRSVMPGRAGEASADG
jgi:glycosyltransferase involved in cell wall biosynthesis